MAKSTVVLAALVAGGLGLARNPGCGEVEHAQGAPNAPCTRTSDCGPGLVCLEGVCREPDGGAPPSASDAGADGDVPDELDAGDGG